MEEEVMANIEIRDFPEVEKVNAGDFVVLSLADGNSAKVRTDLLRVFISEQSEPSIKDGVWWIGSVNTGVQAQGKTPEMRCGELGVEYRYIGDGASEWKLLVPFEEIKLKYANLTKEQQDDIRLKFSDLTEENIAELQKPANDMIYLLEQTNDKIVAEESVRVLSESERGEAEALRVYNEQIRNQKFESLTNEAVDAALEAKEQGSYAKVQGDYAKEQASIVESLVPNMIVGTITSNPASILD